MLPPGNGNWQLINLNKSQIKNLVINESNYNEKLKKRWPKAKFFTLFLLQGTFTEGEGSVQ
jgi:hypothetical protein